MASRGVLFLFPLIILLASQTPSMPKAQLSAAIGLLQTSINPLVQNWKQSGSSPGPIAPLTPNASPTLIICFPPIVPFPAAWKNMATPTTPSPWVCSICDQAHWEKMDLLAKEAFYFQRQKVQVMHLDSKWRRHLEQLWACLQYKLHLLIPSVPVIPIAMSRFNSSQKSKP